MGVVDTATTAFHTLSHRSRSGEVGRLASGNHATKLLRVTRLKRSNLWLASAPTGIRGQALMSLISSYLLALAEQMIQMQRFCSPLTT
jgi:hypothetical protein